MSVYIYASELVSHCFFFSDGFVFASGVSGKQQRLVMRLPRKGLSRAQVQYCLMSRHRIPNYRPDRPPLLALLVSDLAILPCSVVIKARICFAHLQFQSIYIECVAVLMGLDRCSSSYYCILIFSLIDLHELCAILIDLQVLEQLLVYKKEATALPCAAPGRSGIYNIYYINIYMCIYIYISLCVYI